ncbi:hypothetical protein [Erythrobacter alti]|uniref:hypothetical protein n=1 Tax=Erythrobacter alti TaxID=1896145 RepID=UPI0030F45549
MKFSFAKCAIAACVMGATAAPAVASDVLYEEQWARQQEAEIFTAPIAGIENRFWFDYRGNIIEAQEELSSDLRRASDLEDRRDAWEEYGNELIDERTHYIEEMAERGYRAWSVTVE